MNKDFYNNLPGLMCETLDKLIEEYRQHILNSSIDDMRMPGYVFNKYINEN